jgi:hypothetical protein
MLALEFFALIRMTGIHYSTKQVSFMKDQGTKHSTTDYRPALEQLSHLFAHKAEWLNEDLYNLFQSPGYFSVLERNQSCILVGDRGTGKTSVLRGLSYEGQYRLNTYPLKDWKFLGIYYKIEAFNTLRGRGLTDEQWVVPFSHYFNLIICSFIIKMLLWYESLAENNKFNLEFVDWRLFLESLSISYNEAAPFSIKSLSFEIELSIARFSKFLNNIQDPGFKVPEFSTLGEPIDYLVDIVNQLKPFNDKPIYFILDEYEVFSEYQQMIVNTLIKQSAGKKYCFKVGVRELGWREKKTIEGQVLQAPNDYRRISIKEDLDEAKFGEFAEKVCNQRLRLLKDYLPYDLLSTELTVRDLLPSLSYGDEAELLGVKSLADKILSNPDLSLTSEQKDILTTLPPVLIWFTHEWGARRGIGSAASLKNLIEHQKPWKNRLDNYLYASLFAIKKSGRKKYYAGWETYLLMARGNIRFLFQLVEAALREQLQSAEGLKCGVNYDNQTEAAISVGTNNIQELEGVDVKGRKIMRLILGLGRVFEIFANEPFNSGPEVNQFYVPELNGDLVESDPTVLEAKEILEAAYSHLGLMREPSNKLSKGVAKGFDYFVHPIFSAYFLFSFRKKRKTTIHASEIIGLLQSQEKTTDIIIARKQKNKQKAFLNDGLFTSSSTPVRRRRLAAGKNSNSNPGQLPLLFDDNEG